MQYNQELPNEAWSILHEICEKERHRSYSRDDFKWILEGKNFQTLQP